MFLNCHSFHSLRYGTLSVQELVKQASELGVKSLVLTDINTITAVYDFYKECQKLSIKPIVGVEVRENEKLLYITIAKEFSGIGEVNKLLSNVNCNSEMLKPKAPYFEKVFVVYPLSNIPETLNQNEFIGITEGELNLLYRPELKQWISKMVILHPITFKSQKEYNLHRILRAIEKNTLISKLTEANYCKSDEKFKPINQVIAPYLCYPSIIENTQNILDTCEFKFDFSIPRNKKFYTQSKADDLKLLTHLTYTGLEKRYGKDYQDAQKRIEKELKVIDELNFSSYFLITWDIIQYSNSRGFMHIGRGSGANSIVSYCLGITDICPLELDLYFERFLNLNRKSPPDFDIDWSWQERDEILEYIFDRYGRDHVAFCGTNVEFKYRSIFREVGKAFGLPKEELDTLAKNPMATHEDNAVVKQVQKYGMLLEKFPNQRSMHACGILISEEPITNYSILEMPPKGFAIVQFDMHVAEEVGFEKFDILSQRGLGTINDTVKLIEENRGITIDIKDTSISKDEVFYDI